MKNKGVIRTAAGLFGSRVIAGSVGAILGGYYDGLLGTTFGVAAGEAVNEIRMMLKQRGINKVRDLSSEMILQPKLQKLMLEKAPLDPRATAWNDFFKTLGVAMLNHANMSPR